MRWGIYIVTLTGVSRGMSMPPSWFERVFSDPDGVGAYFRQMSGGREDIRWQVFPADDLLMPTEKANLDAQFAAKVYGLRSSGVSREGERR